MAYLRQPRFVPAFFVLLVALALMATTAVAMRVSPMVIELEPAGSGSSGRIEVQNTLPQNLAFETTVSRLVFDDQGIAREERADEDFLIFPPQGVLAPGARQVIRVQYVGAPDRASSQPYYVSVNQLPVALDPAAEGTAAAQVQIVYNMRALVVVAPRNAQPNVSALSARPIVIPASPDDPESVDTPGVEVVLRNTGMRHAFMGSIGWRLEGTRTDGQPMRVDIDSGEMNRFIGTGYVAPNGAQRTFLVPLPAAFAEAPIQVSFVR